MTGIAENWDMNCPKCGRDDGLAVCADIWVRLTPEGTTQPQAVDADPQWNEHHGCICVHCGHAGVVSDFETSRKEPA